uniref:Ribosomal protein S3 n=1 Tax=Rhodymenia pseudopalmata TaxID=31502 RepID=V9NGB0_RHOPU|nr:ribosomal protein S3 [Rhodymenia pseudopalmata]AGO19258.1 ribosomal protein S3 [Rhodymenia pseudopalmata]
MSQKINPISLRLGVTQVWDSTFQFYGKSNKTYQSIFHKNYQAFTFISCIHNCSEFLLGNFVAHFNRNYTSIDFFCSISKPDKICLNLNQISDIISCWYDSKIFLFPYQKMNWFSSTKLISNYVKFLLSQNLNPTIILKDLGSFFELQFESEKIINSVKGPLKVQLKGFKIKLTGRFDNSRNQLSKNIVNKMGALPLTSLKSYLEFTSTEIYTKLGTCGLQIWLFYKIN